MLDAIKPRATDLKGIRLCLAIASILGAIAAPEINSTLMFDGSWASRDPGLFLASCLTAGVILAEPAVAPNFVRIDLPHWHPTRGTSRAAGNVVLGDW
jgi:hypothetical protein